MYTKMLSDGHNIETYENENRATDTQSAASGMLPIDRNSSSLLRDNRAKSGDLQLLQRKIDSSHRNQKLVQLQTRVNAPLNNNFGVNNALCRSRTIQFVNASFNHQVPFTIKRNFASEVPINSMTFPDEVIQLVDSGKVVGGTIVGIEGLIGGGLAFLTHSTPGKILNSMKFGRGILTTVSGFIADSNNSVVKGLNSILTELINLLRDGEAVIAIYAGVNGAKDQIVSAVFMVFRGIIKIFRAIVKHLQSCFKSDMATDAMNKENTQVSAGFLHGIETSLLQMEVISRFFESKDGVIDKYGITFLQELIVGLKFIRTYMDFRKAENIDLYYEVDVEEEELHEEV